MQSVLTPFVCTDSMMDSVLTPFLCTDSMMDSVLSPFVCTDSMMDSVLTPFVVLTPYVCNVEWYFRSSLDRYVWIHGMLFAYLHPSFEAALQRIDKMSTKARLFIRTVITAGQFGWHAAHAGSILDADKDLDSCFVGWT